jgi:hypothetical protein
VYGSENVGQRDNRTEGSYRLKGKVERLGETGTDLSRSIDWWGLIIGRQKGTQQSSFLKIISSAVFEGPPAWDLQPHGNER